MLPEITPPLGPYQIRAYKKIEVTINYQERDMLDFVACFQLDSYVSYLIYFCRGPRDHSLEVKTSLLSWNANCFLKFSQDPRMYATAGGASVIQGVLLSAIWESDLQIRSLVCN